MSVHKKGFNKYKIEGEITIIYLYRKNGEEFKALIDTEDLQKLINLDWSWHTQWIECNQSYYVSTSEYLGLFDGKPKYKTHQLHNIIMNSNKLIDHINHNTLDNRKSNLRFITYQNNLRNRKGRNRRNTSGYRNVSWVNRDQLWYVQLQVNGKNTVLGKFPKDKLEEAGKFAEEMREKYYGEFKGLS